MINTSQIFRSNTIRRFILYLVILMPVFVLVASVWYFLVDGIFYYCSDKLPILNLLPPFVHGKSTGDYFIASPLIVYLLWILALSTIFLLPWLVVHQKFKNQNTEIKKAVLVLGLVGIITGLLIAFVVSFISNGNLLRLYPLPRNCAEYIKTFYNMGAQYYGARLNEDWIEKANRIQKICDEQFPKYYPWDFQSNEIEKVGYKTFSSKKGYFAIELPSEMEMVERKEEKKDDGTIHGEVWFTFEEFNEDTPSGLVVVYGKPRIDGKGGACIDEQGEGAYKTEVIAGQKISVCKVGGFKAEYFTHPSKEVEYWVNTSRLSTEQIKAVSEAVRETLRFE